MQLREERTQKKWDTVKKSLLFPWFDVGSAAVGDNTIRNNSFRQFLTSSF